MSASSIDSIRFDESLATVREMDRQIKNGYHVSRNDIRNYKIAEREISEALRQLSDQVDDLDPEE